MAQEVLNGTYIPPPNSPKYVVDFLATLVMPESIRKLGPVNLSISQQDNSTGWSKMKAKTGSEPSTLNFNHYMSSCSDRNLNQIDTFLQNTVILWGIDVAAWKIITDLQILKKADQYHIDTMCCIQLMDVEFNMTNKHVGRQTLAHAEKANAFPQINTAAAKTTNQSTPSSTRFCSTTHYARNDAQGQLV